MRAAEYRFGVDEPWRIATGHGGAGSIVYYAGPLAPAKVNVKLPRISWRGGQAPARISQPFWKPPIEVAWAFDDVPKRIEYRIGQGPWRKLGGGGTIFVANLAGQTVRLAFRAVEEDVFVSAKTLSATIPVKMRQSLQEWIAQRVELAVADEGVEGQQAVRELAFVREAALQLLQQRLSKDAPQASRIAAVIAQLRASRGALRGR